MTRQRTTQVQPVRSAADVRSKALIRTWRWEDTAIKPAYARAILAIRDQDTVTPTSGSSVVSGPAWNFIVFTIHDPYTGRVIRPETPPQGTRYVAAEVAIANASEQSLHLWSLSLVRLRDRSGFEYEAGSTLGTKPRLSTQNLATGEQARGWVWFTVPVDAQLTELVFIGPAPEFRFRLSSDPSG